MKGFAMSIAVALDEVAGLLAQRPIVYLVTTDGARSKVVQVHPEVADGHIYVGAGPGTLRQLGARPDVVLVAPPLPGDPEAFTLLVDGVAEVVEAGATAYQRVAIKPQAAVLHRRGRD
jgi:hypothetical protein